MISVNTRYLAYERIEEIAADSTGEVTKKARDELRRRDQLRQRFIRSLDDGEIEEIVNARGHHKLGPYTARAGDFGLVELSREDLKTLARDEQARRRREREHQEQTTARDSRRFSVF